MRVLRLATGALYCAMCLTTVPMAGGSDAQRMAVAIRGGASMGAYESGFNWGALAIMHGAGKGDDWMLGGRPYEIDLVSVAGASAGGINTLLSSVTWCAVAEDQGGFVNRIDDNLFRDVWLEPDVNRLLPASSDSPYYLPDDAALARKDFYDIAVALRDKWNRPGAFRPGCRIPLGVTLTRVKPEELIIDEVHVQNQRFYIPFEMRVQPDGSAAFFFDHEDYPTVVDPAMLLMPRAADAAPGSITDDQVLNAVLTTSAFPTAFGRRLLQYCRMRGIVDEDEDEPADPAESAGLVCPDGYELAEAEFSDGGLFDNLPIGLARMLVERNRRSAGESLPVTFLFLDPGRQRFEQPEIETDSACDGDNPPEACKERTFNFASEAAVFKGALDTARQYELYRELTSAEWTANVSRLAYDLAGILEDEGQAAPCPTALPYFDSSLGCSEALVRAGKLLEVAYDYSISPIASPLSAEALLESGVAERCTRPPESAPEGIESVCELRAPRLREQLAAALEDLAAQAGEHAENLLFRIQRSQLSALSDRTIRLSSRAAPITGSLLGAFGAFLEYQFREYDYYLGVYDAVLLAALYQCKLAASMTDETDERQSCIDGVSENVYRRLGVPDDPGASFVFAMAAQREFGAKGGLEYAYTPMPPENRNFRLIHEGLEKTLFVEDDSKVTAEQTLFAFLAEAGFEPTPLEGGGESLLALILEDPQDWSTELIKRWTNRIVRLEQEAARIYTEREPDPDKRKHANTSLLGAGAWLLQTGSYTYPRFAFAPSTARGSWLWRNVIPYELNLDFVESDAQLLWQPTWNVKRTNIALRFGFGFAGGLINSSERENYGTFGLDFTVLTRFKGISGVGITPAVYHAWSDPGLVDQTTGGLDLHAGFLRNRFRVGLGARDVSEIGDTWFLSFGIADLPGAIYWLTR